ncbi:MAG: 50S ribosomal protein L4 [Bacteroidetes bacterium]|jgi:large subunit ribosomal protein L4|nr:50S ribosomal protein L4 [Bacteroidota bacterium]
MELDVYSQDGLSTGRTVMLDDAIFGIEPNEHVVWLDVRRIQAGARQGTHKTKERSDVRGSRRKLYRQKGTGLARAGDAKSPIRKTGGRAHGARPRSYDLDLNKKTRQLARRSAFSAKAQDEALRVVEDFSLDVPNTRQLAEMLQELELVDQKVLILTTAHEPAMYKSSRNMPKVTVKEARNASTLDVLKAQVILLQEGAFDVLRNTFGTAEPVPAE